MPVRGGEGRKGERESGREREREGRKGRGETEGDDFILIGPAWKCGSIVEPQHLT